MVTTIITAMAAYSNERVAAIILSVLYRMLTLILCQSVLLRHNEVAKEFVDELENEFQDVFGLFFHNDY